MAVVTEPEKLLAGGISPPKTQQMKGKYTCGGCGDLAGLDRRRSV